MAQVLEGDVEADPPVGLDDFGAHGARVVQQLVASRRLDADENRNVVLREELRAAIVDGLGVKPRLAFGPLRTAVSGQKISPPLFESMEILGKAATINRLKRLHDEL